MNTLQQYLDIYTGERDTIDAHSAPLLNRLRPEAYEVLRSATLPARGDENYVHTEPADIYAFDYGLNLSRLAFPTDTARTFRCGVPNMSTLLGVVVNDTFAPSRTLRDNCPQGVSFLSLRKAAVEMPQLIERCYGSAADLSDPATALNTLLCQDGVLIHIAEGVRLEKPLQLVNIFSAPTSLLAPRRVLIVAERGSSAEILICDHTQDTATNYLDANVTEIILAEDARLDVCHIEESSALTARHANICVRQAERSDFHFTDATLTCGTTRNNFSIDLSGAEASAQLASMAIASGRQTVDNNIVLRHLAPHTSSRQHFKYVLDDEARGAFSGRILVSAKAPYTDAYQTNRNILAAPTARMHTKPQLEIYTDDVKCSHGATTGQLDSEALFYMQTRGIPEAEARHMLMQAFMADVIDTVRIEGLRDRLRHLVERRFTDRHASGCTEGCMPNCNDHFAPQQ